MLVPKLAVGFLKAHALADQLAPCLAVQIAAVLACLGTHLTI